MEVEQAGDDVYHNPDKPLFEVFVSECPDTYEAECRGETVGQGDAGVGKRDQEPVDDGPDGYDNEQPGQDEALGKVAYGEFLLRPAATHPSPVTVDGHGNIVELHAAVGIESFLIVQHDAQ